MTAQDILVRLSSFDEGLSTSLKMELELFAFRINQILKKRRTLYLYEIVDFLPLEITSNDTLFVEIIKYIRTVILEYGDCIDGGYKSEEVTKNSSAANQYSRALSKIKHRLSKTTINELHGKYIVNGDVVARNEIVEPYFPLIRHMILKNIPPFMYSSSANLTFEDCLQIGNLALVRSLETYHAELGSVTSYASKAIIRSIHREFKKNVPGLKVPEYKLTKYLNNKHGWSLRKNADKSPVSFVWVDKCDIFNLVPLHTLSQDNRNFEIADSHTFEPDYRIIAKEDLAEMRMTLQELAEAVYTLKPRGRKLKIRDIKIFLLRYGLETEPTTEDEYCPISLEKIGEQFGGLTREGVRVIVSKIWTALGKIQHLDVLNCEQRFLAFMKKMSALESVA